MKRRLQFSAVFLAAVTLLNLGGTGSTARFIAPRGVAVDRAGNLFVAAEVNNRITKGTSAYP